MPAEEPIDAARSARPRWVWRTLGLSVPLHLGVFVLLYLGGMYLFETETIRAHSRDSQLLVLAAVNNLHLIMRDDSREQARQRLAEFVRGIEEMDLHLWSADGERIADRHAPEVPDPREVSEVRSFLADGKDQQFWLDRENGGPFLRGMVRIRTDQRCAGCHAVGETRGVASMTRDLSTEVGNLHRRLVLVLLLGALVWVALAYALNRVTARALARSAAQVQADLDAPGGGGAGASPSAAARILDPMSTAVFESLQRSLAAQRRREEDFATRLHQADRLASLGQLAAGLAHEIKNPLAGIQGALEILRDESGSDDDREVHDQMLAELKRVDGIIRALLGFARPAPPQRAAVDVARLLDDTVALLRPGLERRGVTLELETAPDLPPFSLDAQQIRQVLVNLITNAAEAIAQDSASEGGRVAVRATVFPQDGSLVLTVEDDGPGIPEEHLKKIFEPFFTSKFTGTGLGLAVTDRLVTQHGGRIEVESKPGHGSTFFVILPVPQEHGQASPAPAGGE